MTEFIIPFILLALFSFIMLISVTLWIINRKEKLKRKKWVIMTFVTLPINFFLSTYIALNLFFITIKSESLRNTVAEALSSTWSDERPIDTNNHQIKLIQSYIPDSTLKQIPNKYFSYFGFRDWWRYPLVYPYAIRCIDRVDYGYLCNEKNAIDIANSSEGVTQLKINNIRKFTFDRRFLFGIIQERNSDDIQYFKFNFDNETQKFYSKKEEFRNAMLDVNFDGDTTLVTLLKYDSLF